MSTGGRSTTECEMYPKSSQCAYQATLKFVIAHSVVACSPGHKFRWRNETFDESFFESLVRRVLDLGYLNCRSSQHFMFGHGSRLVHVHAEWDVQPSIPRTDDDPCSDVHRERGSFYAGCCIETPCSAATYNRRVRCETARVARVPGVGRDSKSAYS